MEIIGNITSQELRLAHTEAGVPYVQFRIAQDTYKGSGANRVKDAPLFFNVTAWRSLAEGIVKTLSKGTPVVGVGYWAASDYKGKEGEDRHAQWIVAEALGPDLRRIDATVTRRERADKEAKVEAVEDPFEED